MSVTTIADDSKHEGWMPVIPKPLGSEAVELPYEWNEDDDMAVQVRGLMHNLFMDEEDSQIKLMATDYAMIMTGVREPQGILEDGDLLIGAYYGEFGEDAVDKISVLGNYESVDFDYEYNGFVEGLTDKVDFMWRHSTNLISYGNYYHVK